VKTVQKLINISAPTVGTPAATWTANVFLLPVDAVNDPSSIFRGVAVTKTLLQSPTPFANPGTYGLLMVCKAWDVTGTEPANPFSSTFNPANAEFESITLGDAWNGEGSARLTSCGYEIVDNTAQLYKGGNMVNWRKTSTAADAPMMVSNAAVSAVAPDTRIFAGFPDTLETAFRIPGTTSTRFQDGTYVVGTLNKNREDFEQPNGYGATVMCPRRPFVGSAAGIHVGFLPRTPVVTYGDDPAFWIPYTYTHLDQSGSFCTGLQEQATFTLTLKATLEIIPNANSVLIDFTTPAPPFNPKLDELYSNLAQQMPPSAPVADNASGDFFRRLIKVAAPVISTIFPQAAPVVKTVAGAADSGIAAIQRNRENKSAKKAKQPNENKKLIETNTHKIKTLENTMKRLTNGK